MNPRIDEQRRPTHLLIHREHYAHNIRQLRAMAKTRLMAVVKANAYGHGVHILAPCALEHGADALAVATIDEAHELRTLGIRAPILILGYLPPWQAAAAVALQTICTVFDIESARALSQAACEQQQSVMLHLKVDTGMARLGVAPNEAGHLLTALQQLDGVSVEGIYTHFATADSTDETLARTQLTRFKQLLDDLTRAALRPPIAHAANSAALLRFPSSHLDMVRPGIATYGLHPSAEETRLPDAMKPVLTWKTCIAQLKTLPIGTPISYGAIFVTSRPSIIATLPVGYGDGLRRAPPWREVLIHGQRAPIVGRICMDYTLVDVTDLSGVAVGDEVVLLGAQGDASITAEEVAAWVGTINYEVVTALLPRVPRIAV